MKIYNTSGNKFLIGYEDIDVIKMCEKYECDGYLKVKSHQIEVFNKDNTKANLCVNGLHCFTKFLYDINLDYKLYALVINQEIYMSEILSIEPFISKIRIKPPKSFRNFVDVGNQHKIILDDDMSEAEHYSKRYDCNIDYVKIIDRNYIEVTSYERGVGFTLSCGSGNVASSVYCYENDLCDQSIKVINKGGTCDILIGKNVEITSMSVFEREI